MMLEIACKLPDTREPAYLVGGSIRDLLLKRTPEDYDIVVPGNPEPYARKLAAVHHARAIALGKDEKRIFRVKGRDAMYDVSQAKGESIAADLLQRDFTVNAMAYDTMSGDIIDVTHGRRDLDAGQIRMVSASIFDQDPVRLLRAYRVAAQLGFRIEKHTSDTIQKKAHLIRLAAGERIRDEWFNILEQSSISACLTDMHDTGLLLTLLPELRDLTDLKQNRYHEFDALTHTLKTVEHLESLFECPEQILPQSAGTLDQVSSPQRRMVLKCAAVLHDVGKPAAASIDDKGMRHYYGHEKIGARMVENIGRKFRFSNQERKSIALIVRQHLRPLFLFNQADAAMPKKRLMARFFLACRDLVPDIVLHAVADSQAKKTDPDRHHQQFVEFADSLLLEYFNGFKAKIKAPRLVNGNDLIQEFGLVPSPVFTTILKQVEEARIAGEINSRADALHLVEQILNNNRAT
jgi:tRNA nucleotidyltransferase/poly(A) polymerase